MKLYLVRHGNAVEKNVDPQRPLSEEGIKQIEKITSFIKPHEWNVHVILHSDKLRAAQTAAILGSAFHSGNGIMQMKGLAPLDPIYPICERIENEENDMMIVGHLPFLDHLVSFLLNRDETMEILGFPEGGMVCLEYYPDKKRRLKWFLDPRLIP